MPHTSMNIFIYLLNDYDLKNSSHFAEFQKTTNKKDIDLIPRKHFNKKKR